MIQLDKISISSSPCSSAPLKYLFDETLCSNAFRAIHYLATRPEGWVPKRENIRKDLGVGDRAWRRISKQLRERGILSGDRELIYHGVF